MSKTHEKVQAVRSVGGVVLNPYGQVLLVEQRGNVWSLPKGQKELDETDIETAEREIYEEAGVKFVEHIKELGSYERHKIGISGADDTSILKHITFHLFRTNQMEIAPLDADHPQAQWVDVNDVEHYLPHPKYKAFFTSIRAEIELQTRRI